MAIDPRIPVVASATALVVPDSPAYRAGSETIFITVTGNVAITSIVFLGNLRPGVRLFIHFQGTPTLTDGNNILIAGNFVATADDTFQLITDGTNWYECGGRAAI